MDRQINKCLKRKESELGSGQHDELSNHSAEVSIVGGSIVKSVYLRPCRPKLEGYFCYLLSCMTLGKSFSFLILSFFFWIMGQIVPTLR